MLPAEQDTHDMTRACVLRAIALNVRSLMAKLDMILSLPFDVFCLSEVRASWSAKRAMSRVASAAGFAAVWSNSPPPSPTFRVSPWRMCNLCACSTISAGSEGPGLRKMD